MLCNNFTDYFSPSRIQALVEILLLSGGTPFANFKDLAHAWGREKGFHLLLATSVCERRGEVERKKRSDAGRTMTTEQRKSFRDKLKQNRLHKEGDDEIIDPDNSGVDDTKMSENGPSTVATMVGATIMDEGNHVAVAPSKVSNSSTIETESVSV